MKKTVFLIIMLIPILTLCTKKKPFNKIVNESLAFSVKQYGLMAEVMNGKPGQLPRTIDKEGNIITENSDWWTSGFFPGSLWYLYEYSKDQKIKDYAMMMTSRVEKEKYNTKIHDVGFMLYCSFGNGLRLTGEESYVEVLITGARSLSTRFRPKTGCIQSWESNDKWQSPVIIDNMMNLELLMWAFKKTGDSSYYKIAVSHADITMKNHFRPDYSSYHVVSYDTVAGTVEVKQTAQGANDESVWSRGQSWGLYGYTMMYRETKLDRYLRQAEHIADFLINHPFMPKDKIPYWDYEAPGIPYSKRDASAAAIMASALIELSGFTNRDKKAKYLHIAETQLYNLASPKYRSELGKNGNFILKHSVGSLPDNWEVDVPLTYADYYFIEALVRYTNLKKE